MRRDASSGVTAVAIAPSADHTLPPISTARAVGSRSMNTSSFGALPRPVVLRTSRAITAACMLSRHAPHGSASQYLRQPAYDRHDMLAFIASMSANPSSDASR